MSLNPSYPSGESPVVIAVERSSDTKLSTDRSCSATWVSQGSCPDDCPFLNNGCYAENHLSGNVVRRLNSAQSTGKYSPDDIAIMEVSAIDDLTGKRDLRLHVVGDTTTDAGARALAGAAERYSSRFGKTVWTYTHAWARMSRKSWGSISVLGSCQSVAQAQAAHKAGYASAMVVEKYEVGEDGKVPVSYPITGSDLTGIPCPKTTHRKASCKDCKLCWHADALHRNKQTILFETHGTRRFAANRVLARVAA